ncbi:unnamed protein product [Phaedon cochleariae]|uniref:Double jelly roll-like domain-containing protein n=1 Tax=Phaedon cochleariae TaxID=80249 RepID=A0A9N9X2C6_PHACE|nr:unnamed protein product [Phaedon cochleariae]
MFEGINTIKGKLKVTGGGTGTLTHNAGAYLFDSCTYELCNKELDTVRYPGITSTVRGYLCYTPENSRHLAIAGWNYPNALILNTDGTLSMNIPLKHLFSIFNDHQVATWGKQSIRLVRARNDANSMKVVERANTALPGSPQTQSIAKITIESINLKVPHLTPNDDMKLQLLTRIKADEPMMIPFRRWELHELPALTQGSTIEIWSVKTCSALDSPRYVIVFFQKKKADNLHEDVTLFDNANIKSIRLALNSDYYPQERMLLDFSKDQYADAHFNNTEFNKSYHNCQEKRSLVNFAEFKSRPIFVIDFSRRHLGSPQTQSIAKITIESINLKVPHLTPNDDMKLQLLTRIKADEPMMIPFRRWELHELPALTQGSTIEIWSVKTCSALDSPRYVIVFFQKKKADNLHEDVTLFDNANIKSIRLALNSDYYPQERMLLDFSKDQYADAHFNNTEFNKSYHNCQEKRSLVNFAEFKSRPIFVIDFSRRHLACTQYT